MTISNAELAGLHECYRNLAEAIGVEINSENAEPFLKKFIKDVINIAVREADASITGLATKVSSLNKNIDIAKGNSKNAIEIANRALINSRNVSTVISEEYQKQAVDFEDRCKEITSVYFQQMNPFHQAIEDFLKQLDEHNFPPEERGKPLAAFIKAMGYLQWQSNKIKDEKEDEYIPKKAGRLLR